MRRDRTFLTAIPRAIALTAAMVWVAGVWEPFYLVGTAQLIGEASAAERFLLLLPMLLATAGALMLFDVAVRSTAGPDLWRGAGTRRVGSSQVLGAALALLLVGGLTHVLIVRPLAAEPQPVVIAPQGAIGQAGQALPAGELVDRSVIAQSLDSELLRHLRGLHSDVPLCLEVLFATYLGRDNVGEIELALSGGSGSDRQALVLPVPSLADNAWAGGCFEEGWDQVLTSSDAEVVVRGLGATSGQAATVWMRQSGSMEPDARVSGVLPPFPFEGHALTYRFATLQDSSERSRLFGWYSRVLLLAGCGLAVAFFSGRRSSQLGIRGRPDR